ncbi:molybdate ABC transporter substrate-binding protein [Castellaniella sp.]|uniref:molybdate ABC transporter substrate-binding protein n=1 Tax=Castellaniella sp. TaxID=1955812 RepID=UPI003C72B43C
MSAAPTPTLHILSAGAAKGLVGQMEDTFGRRHAHAISGEFGAVGLMREHFMSGAACDLIILSQKLIDGLAADGLLQADSIRPLGVVRTGIAHRAGAPAPRVTDPHTLAQALQAAPEIYFPDPEKATAGIHFIKVLSELGLAESLAQRLRPFPNGATAMRELAAHGAQGAIGCTQVTEILYTPGVSLAGPLPARFELATVYAAAIPTRAGNPATASSLIALLTGPDAEQQRRRGGFEPA